MNTSSFLTVNDWLKSATNSLASKKISSARLDGLIILETVLGLPRHQIIAEANQIIITTDQAKQLNNKLNQRLNYEPIAYIRGFVEFYRHNFKVSSDVLIPRPESESFIDLLKTLKLDKHTKLADIGCGSGCLGITAKLEFPTISVDLIEISKPAIAVAKANAEQLSARVGVIESNLLENNNTPYDVLLVNLPYVPKHYKLDKSTAYEPSLAIFADKEGLSMYEILFNQINLKKDKPKYLLTESLLIQHIALQNLANQFRYIPIGSSGLVQLYQLT